MLEGQWRERAAVATAALWGTAMARSFWGCWYHPSHWVSCCKRRSPAPPGVGRKPVGLLPPCRLVTLPGSFTLQTSFLWRPASWPQEVPPPFGMYVHLHTAPGHREERLFLKAVIRRGSLTGILAEFPWLVGGSQAWLSRQGGQSWGQGKDKPTTEGASGNSAQCKVDKDRSPHTGACE